MTIRIDFASEGCQWEPEDCPEPGAGMAGEWWGVYCTEHLETWRKEIDRQEERDRPKLDGMQAWYQRMTQQRGAS